MTSKGLQSPQRRLLSIDGGGILGTFLAAFLAGLEQHLPKPIGTSTDGIIAVGLVVGLRAAGLGWSIPRRDGRRETSCRPQARAEAIHRIIHTVPLNAFKWTTLAASSISRGLATLSRVIATGFSNPFFFNAPADTFSPICPLE